MEFFAMIVLLIILPFSFSNFFFNTIIASSKESSLLLTGSGLSSSSTSYTTTGQGQQGQQHNTFFSTPSLPISTLPLYLTRKTSSSISIKWSSFSNGLIPFWFQSFIQRFRWVRLLFLISFTISIDLLILPLLEVAGSLILSSFFRKFAWRITLLSLVGIQLFLIPIACAYFATLHISTLVPTRLFASFLYLFLFYYFLYRLGQLFPLFDLGVEPESESNLSLFLGGCVGRFGVAGVVTGAALSGYGAIATPYSYLSALLYTVTPADAQAKKNAWVRLSDRLSIMQRKLSLLQQQANDINTRGSSSSSSSSSSIGGGILNPSLPTSSNNSNNNSSCSKILINGQQQQRTYLQLSLEIKAAERNVRIADEVNQETYLDYCELITALERQKAGKTIMGRALTLLGYSLSLYAICKVGMALYNLIFKKDPTSIDPVTRGLELVLVIFVKIPRAEAEHWLQPVSIAFVALLISVSLRGFLNALSTAGSLASKYLSCCFSSLSSSSSSFSSSFSDNFQRNGNETLTDVTILFLAQLMCCYCVSVLLLLRTSIPEEFRKNITSAIGANIRIAFFQSLFDAIFILSACASGVAHIMAAALSASRVHVSDEERRDAAFSSMSTTSLDEGNNTMNTRSTSRDILSSIVAIR